MRRGTATLAVVTAVSILSAQAARGQAAEVESGIAYVDGGHAEQVLDLHWPAGSPRASLVFVHGGGLKEDGERRTSPRYREVCRPFVAAGIACASMDYRLAPSFRWPAMAEDVASAIRFVRERVASRGGDPGRLFLFGHSSGCHLVAVVATNAIYLRSVDLEPSDLAGIVPMGCTLDRYDTALRGAAAEDVREAFRQSASDVERFGTAENWIAANPAHHIGPHVPPTLVVLAREERFFPSILEQGARFVRLLLEAGVPADLVIVPGSHRSSVEDLGEPADPTFAAIRRFIADPRSTDGRR